MKYSVIIPVYNRIAEVEDLMRSLSQQTCKDFEVIIVEDGSSEPCEDAVKEYEGKVDVKYFFKENEGRSIARNYGMERASGEYFIFFDSDCIIPPVYFDRLNEELEKNPVDCFGGPDSADESFSDVQKAINYSMTSFLTTGGIRGGSVQLEKFTPRTFNMGFSRKVYDAVGGFREMFSEDIDMSMRIKNAGFSIALIRPAVVFHKRRVNFRKFFRQVYVFGMSRITLKLIYPDSMKPVHCLPALAVLAAIALIVLAIAVSPWFLAPMALYLIAIFVAAYITTEDPWIAVIAVPASVIQIGGYGLGFLKAYITKIIFRRGRNVEEEIMMRKGK